MPLVTKCYCIRLPFFWVYRLRLYEIFTLRFHEKCVHGLWIRNRLTIHRAPFECHQGRNKFAMRNSKIAFQKLFSRHRFAADCVAPCPVHVDWKMSLKWKQARGGKKCRKSFLSRGKIYYFKKGSVCCMPRASRELLRQNVSNKQKSNLYNLSAASLPQLKHVVIDSKRTV